MRARKILVPTASLAAAALLSFPRTVEGYLLSGFTLNTNTRDARVFNDWPPASNVNQTPDPNFPDVVGAPLAVWKGATELASTLHNGQGFGDPTQTFPNGLGSGGANFDFVFLGLAPTAPLHTGNPPVPSSPNDKLVHLASSNYIGPGVLAVTIAPDAMGWHIEFMPDQVWFDGPANMPFGDPRFDIQGIGCHELGHALGLGHTTVATATMFAAANPGPASVTLRSIEADDIAGIKANYGQAAATKPRVLGFQGIIAAQQPMTVLGLNFSTALPGQNEVWINDGGADNNPLKVTGLASTNGGTQISLIPPCQVMNGDLFVKVGTSTLGATLSNGMPIVFPGSGNGLPCIQCLGTVAPNPVPVLSVPPTEVFLTAPSGSPAMTCFPTTPLCVTPSLYSTVTQVQVGPFTLGTGQFTIDNDNQIRFTLPLFSSLGNANVTLTNAGGVSCPATLTVAAVTAPVLSTGAPIQLPGSTFTAAMAAPLGFNHFLLFSASNVPSILPGIVSLGIGSNFSDLNSIPMPVPNAAGVTQVSFTVPTVPGGGTAYLQMAAVNATNPFAFLPLPVSTVSSVTVP